MQENESIQIKPRRKRRSPGQIAELVREFGVVAVDVVFALTVDP
jgi:hypothetical protein